MQRYELSALPTGERLISEQRRRACARCRSASGSAPARGTRPTQRAGVSHFIEHLLFKGSSRALGAGDRGDLRRARRRAERRHLARDDAALRARARRPARAGARRDGRHGLRAAFAELDSEREVVLEEIAMVDDNPQDLVHDVIAEAVFGGHPLGRPVIGRAEVISTGQRRALAAHHRAAYAPTTSWSRWRATSPTSARRAARARDCPADVARPGRAAQAVHAPARTGLPVPAQADRAVPRLPRRARDLAARRPPLRGLAARRDRRRLRVVPALPGDPREARDGVLRLQLRLAVLRRRPDRPLRRHARGEPGRVHGDRRAGALGRRGRQRPRRASSSGRRRT